MTADSPSQQGFALRRLHIGGQVRTPGWEVLDANPGPCVDHVADASNLGDFENDSFDQIYASHVLEHFDYRDKLLETLKEWYRVLRPAGTLCVSVPDLDVLARLFIDRNLLSVRDRFQVMCMIFGGHTDKYDYHLVGLNEEFLTNYLHAAGFDRLCRVKSFGLFQDTSCLELKSIPISLNMTAAKKESGTTKVGPPKRREFESIYLEAIGKAATHDYQGAIELYQQAIAVNPYHAEAFYKRGNALRSLGQLNAALASYNRAIELKSDYAYAYCNRGVVQQSLGLANDALSSYDQAIALEPNDAMTHYNRALLMQESFRWDEALAGYDRAIAIDPGYSDAQYNRSLALLFQGDFERGWQGYEWRWKNAQRLSIAAPRNFEQPLWLGDESIAGKRLFLYHEAGLGDTLQFCRYASLAAKLGAIVLLEVQEPLRVLLGNLEGVSQLIGEGCAVPPFDYHCPLMSLPLAFKTTINSVPASPRYLQSSKANFSRWQEKLGPRTGLRIGLAWSGNRNNTIDHRRSIRLADLLANLPAELQYFRLQKDIPDADRTALNSSTSIVSFDADWLDFVDTAALCECMDLVISVDTSIAHLSGALGVKTWLLLPFNPDWRWMRDRNDSPWYPTLKLYRQKVAGDWNEVLGRVADDLRREYRSSAVANNGS